MKKNYKNFERQRLSSTITRLDHYFDSVNNKCALYLSVNTFIVGGLVVLLSQSDIFSDAQWWSITSISGCGISGFVSLGFTCWASIPFSSSKPDSLYYFGTIGRAERAEFFTKSKNLTPKEDLNDLRTQVHELSRGLSAKFQKLKVAGLLLFAEFVLFVPILFILISKT
jgi:hypothetical protein